MFLLNASFLQMNVLFKCGKEASGQSFLNRQRCSTVTAAVTAVAAVAAVFCDRKVNNEVEIAITFE